MIKSSWGANARVMTMTEEVRVHIRQGIEELLYTHVPKLFRKEVRHATLRRMALKQLRLCAPYDEAIENAGLSLMPRRSAVASFVELVPTTPRVWCLTLPDLRANLERQAQEAEQMQTTAPTAAVLRHVLTQLAALETHPATGDASPVPAVTSWRERFWECDPNVRLGVKELAEAVGRPKSWLYRHTGKAGRCPRIPHRRIDGELTFVVGEVRVWLIEHEVVEVLGGTTRPRPPLVRPADRSACDGLRPAR